MGMMNHTTHGILSPIKAMPDGPEFDPVSTAFELPNGETRPFVHVTLRSTRTPSAGDDRAEPETSSVVRSSSHGAEKAVYYARMRCELDRRTVLRAASAVAASAVAGCSENTGSDEEGDADGGGANESNEGSNNGSEEREGANDSSEEENATDSDQRIEPPAEVDEYLSDANLYEGAVVDMADEDAIEVSVGAGNGLAFDPPAVRVSPGIEVTWTWTGEGGAHNVVSDPEGGEHGEDGHSEGDGGEERLNSGNPETGGEITYSETLEEPAVHLYHCHPHAEAGMKGAVVVEE